MIKLQIPAFKKIEAQAQAMSDCISFSQGALRVGGVPPQIREKAREILLSDRADYYGHTLGIMPFREKLAEYLSARHNISIKPQQIFVTHGGTGALAATFLTTLDAGDEVLLPTPTYPVYQNIIRMSKAIPVFVDVFREKIESNGTSSWVMDLDRLAAAITSKTKMLVIANPSNPTGMSLGEREMRSLKDLCEKNNIYFVSDEVYEHYVFEGDFYSCMPFVVSSNRVIRVGSFSKNFSMSGWRVGFVVLPAELADTYSAIQSASICCPTVVSQYAAMYALDNAYLMNDQIAIVKQDRDIAYSGLEPLVKQGILSVAYPKCSFYLFVKTPVADSSDMVMDILQNAKVALAPGKDFGPSCTAYFRLCYARDPKLVKEGVARLAKYFQAKFG